MGLSWITTAREHLGTAEVPGPRDNKRILQWAKKVGGFSADYYKADSIPWCGLFVAYCLAENGYKVVKPNPLRALAWAEYGTPVKKPVPGSIMVFVRDGGGHVGFLVAESTRDYQILGGNQADRVSIMPYPKSRFVAARWPVPVSEKPPEVS